MSIFDHTSGFDPTDWIREKSLKSLEITASLVDLANEPDTTQWYSKNIKRIASSLIHRLAPMVALFYSLGQEGADSKEWEDIAERGSFAFIKFCKKWHIVDPRKISPIIIPKQGKADDSEDKSETIKQDISFADNKNNYLKLMIYSRMSLKMVHDTLTVPARKILAWSLYLLELSDYADIVVLSKTFLPTDINCSADEVKEGYKFLYEMGLIEKVDGLDIRDDDIAIRLILEGYNDSKHPIPYQNEKFGAPGIRIAGKPTMGNMVLVEFSDSLNKAMDWLSKSPEKIFELKKIIQEKLGQDNVYIEKLNLNENQVSDKNTKKILTVHLRCPYNTDDSKLENEINKIVKNWIKKSGFHATPNQ